MATIIGGVFSSHVPALGGAIARGAQSEPYWKPFFDAFPPIRDWLRDARPDVVVAAYNDHGLNFFLDKMPTFAVGAAPEYRNADEGWGLAPVAPFAGEPELSWRVIERLVEEEFDPVSCQEMLVDHALSLPMALLWPDQRWPVRLLPLCVNTVQFPLPSAARCWKFGRAIGRAIEGWERDARVLVLGSGGLSHQLDGERAGFINKAFDLKFMDSLLAEPTWATGYSTLELVELAGTQGVELLNWLVARAMLGEGRARKVSSTYHIPISNTAAGVMLLEPP